MMRLKNIFGRRALNRGAECGASFGLGLLAGILIFRFGFFEFEWKFNVVNFVTLIMTFVITFHLQQTLSQRTGDDRIEKQILIDQCKALEGSLAKIADICRTGGASEFKRSKARGVLLEFRALNNQLRAISRLFELTPIRPERAKIGELWRQCLTLKQVATGGAFPNAPLSPEENRRVQECVSQVSESVFALIVYINRL